MGKNKSKELIKTNYYSRHGAIKSSYFNKASKRIVRIVKSIIKKVKKIFNSYKNKIKPNNITYKSNYKEPNKIKSPPRIINTTFTLDNINQLKKKILSN